MNKKKSIRNLNKKQYIETASLINEVESFISNIEGHEGACNPLTKPARRLAAKIFKEWSGKLKKSEKLKDQKLSKFLIGLVGFLE